MNEREIFSGAIALDSPSQRAAFLDDACAGDEALRNRVEQLLRDQQSLGSFLESPPPGVAPTSHSAGISEREGSEIGRYKLLQKLGDGGMGVVYMAEQREPVQRRVALKIIKPGMDTEQVIARFEAERQALAMMDHQNIARVFEAGSTDSGRPYFVMELVRGVPITEYCDKNTLTPVERVELFLPVCQAIQHAHQKGIIHRDIKPSNLMVTLYDGKPVPKIIDFGVAKATAQRLTEKTMFTLYGQIVGTLEYMSPEQAEMSALDIDTRSDIYSLGVLLYELLTGSTPLTIEVLRKAALPEMLRLIREHEPERPSTRLDQSGESLATISAQRRTDPQQISAIVRGELDWIVLKALEKDRTRRYETANGLARDIQRFLDDEPVEACPPSPAYRLRKQLRKHRHVAVAVSAVFVSLVAGLVASLAMYSKSEISRRQATVARAAEQRRSNELRQALGERDKALGAKSDALDALNAALDDRGAALQVSEASRLAAESAAALNDDPGLALVLAVESALRVTEPTVIQNNVLNAALAQTRETRTLLATRPGGREMAVPLSVTSASFNRDGTKIISLAEGAEQRSQYRGKIHSHFRLGIGLAQVWDRSGNLLATVNAPPAQKFAAVDVSPDGRWLVGRFKNSMLVYHGSSNNEEEWAACLYSNRVARVWDLETAEEVHVLRGHTDRITAARFSPDGQKILTSSSDNTLRIWDAVTGEQLKTIAPEANAVNDAYFTPRGEILAVLPGAIYETRYVGKEKGEHPVDEFDPPVDLDRRVTRSRDGERGFRQMKVSFQSPVKVPLLDQLPFADTGQATVRLWDGGSFEEIPLAWDNEPNRDPPDFSCVQYVGDSLLLGTTAGDIIVLSIQTRKQTARFETELKRITSIQLSTDQQRLVAVDSDGAMAVMNCSNGRVLQSWQASEWKAESACFGSTGEFLFVVHRLPAEYSYGAGSRGKIVMLDVATGDTLGWLKGHSGEVSRVLLSPQGLHVVTASSDGTARLWRADLNAADATVLAGFGPVKQAIFSPDGEQILVTSAAPKDQQDWKGFGIVYDASTGQRRAILSSETHPLIQHGIGAVRLAQFSRDGQRILTVSDDRHLRVIDGGGSSVDLLTLPQEKWPLESKPDFTPVRVWDAQSGRELFVLEGLEMSVVWARFTPDGERIITLCERRNEYTDLQMKDGELHAIGKGGGLVNDEQLPQVHVWDGRTGKLLMTLRDLQNPHTDLSDDGRVPLALSPDGNQLVITQLTGLIELGEMKRYVLPGIWSDSIPKFSPDGRYLLTFTQREAMLLNLQQLISNKGTTGGEVEIYHYDADGSAQRTTIPRASDRRYERHTVKGHKDRILSASFSHDGKLFATTSADRTVRVWNSENGQLHGQLLGHPGPVRQAVFSPDGKYIATRSSDSVVRVFLAENGREFVTLRGHRGPINWLAFSADSKRLLTASDDGTSRLWHVDPLPVAMEHRPRNLTDDESVRYGISETLTDSSSTRTQAR